MVIDKTKGIDSLTPARSVQAQGSATIPNHVDGIDLQAFSNIQHSPVKKQSQNSITATSWET